MPRLLGLVLVACSLLSVTCSLPVDERALEPDAEAAPVVIQDAMVRTEKDLQEEAALLAEADEIIALSEAGLPLPGEEGHSDQSAYQLSLLDTSRLGGRSSGILLARMTVSEGTSIMPLRSSWKRDMQGILQVVRNNQRDHEGLYDALGRHSPHVARIKEYTRPRQRWTSTLPAKGKEPPELWTECTSWYTNKKGRTRGLPKGCNGVWLNGADNWVGVRDYGLKLVKMRNPPEPVQGKPKAWGGKMDIWAFLKKRPHMCWLESGDTRNYFFGDKDDPANQCKEVPPELLKESRTISVSIMRRDMRRLKAAQAKEQ